MRADRREPGRLARTRQGAVITRPLLVQAYDQPAVFTGRFTIGGAGDYPLTDVFASDHHAVLWPGDDGWLIADLGSVNGTRLNNRRIWGPRWLNRGDRLIIGRTVIIVVPVT